MVSAFVSAYCGIRACSAYLAPQECLEFSRLVESSLLFRMYSPPLVDTTWLWVYFYKIPIYPIFYLLKGDYTC